MIDSHTHLHLCPAPADELVAAALEAGVTKMLTVGTDSRSCREALQAAEDFPQVWAAVGRHPNAAAGFADADLAELEALAGHPRCLAIGETGLDFFRQGAPEEDQRRAFLAHIELARRLDKPLVIHTRAADEATLEILSSHAADLKVILHCFSMAPHIDRCLAHPNWWISFAGNVTYPRSEDLRTAALAVPAERLLVETDAPYLSPQPIRKERNRPAAVVHTAQTLAVERRVPYAVLEAEVQESAAAVLGW